MRLEAAVPVGVGHSWPEEPGTTEQVLTRNLYRAQRFVGEEEMGSATNKRNIHWLMEISIQLLSAPGFLIASSLRQL